MLDNVVENAIKSSKQSNFDWNETGRGDFSEFGRPDMYFEYRRLAFIPTKELYDMMGRNSKQVINQSSITMGDAIRDLEGTIKQFLGLITDWNIEFNGKQFDLPKDNPNIVNELPNFIANYVVLTIKNDPTNIDLLDSSGDNSFLAQN